MSLTLDREVDRPLHVQLTEKLRHIILTTVAEVAVKLPPSRQLALDLSVSRSTVLAAFDQLTAEGYLVSHQGAGTFVAENIPHLNTPSQSCSPEVELHGPNDVVPFDFGTPDLTNFPYEAWGRHLQTAWSKPHPDLLKKPDPLGWAPLRIAIAEHLKAWRSIECSAGQVIITSGAIETINHIAKLFQKGDEIIIESPCHTPLWNCLGDAGLLRNSVQVDDKGLDTNELDYKAVAAIVTPSRQFPLGMTLSLDRRIALLEWAERSNALIIEDDYDSEFRFMGQPLPALSSIDEKGRTIYVGSFSKLLSPTVRIGYMVVPKRLVRTFESIIKTSGNKASMVPQPALARFMNSGEFATHLRRMRRMYAIRQRTLLEQIDKHLQEWITLDTQPNGMHVVCYLTKELEAVGDKEIAKAALEQGVFVSPLSQYYKTPTLRQGLILGFAAYEEEAIISAVAKLKSVLINLVNY